MMTLGSVTVGDVLSGAVCRNKKVDMDAVLPFLLLPLLLLTATISFTVTIIVMVIIGMGTLYVLSRPRAKNRSKFFFSWTLASILTMYLVYQFYVLKCYEITFLENLLCIVLVLCTCYFFYKMKAIADNELSGTVKGEEYSPVLTSDSYYCQVCQIEVNERFFHSIWWDCCVFRPNYGYFLSGQFLALVTLLHGTNLSLTTVCQPVVVYGNLIVPRRCDTVYEQHWYALIFVTCVYAAGYLFVVTLVLFKQIIFHIPKYTALQWRKYAHVLNV